MANALAVRNEEMDLDTLQRTATMLVASGYFDAKGDRNMQIAQLATKIMAGRELGYGPFASVQGIHVIQGKPQISANLMAAAVKSHPRYDYKVRKMADDAVAIEFFENGQSLGVSEFTKADAVKAKTQNLDKFPRNMLFARALSNGVRWYCPDVFYGNSVYVEGEIEETGDDSPPAVMVVDRETGEVIEGNYTETPAPSTNGNGHKPEPPAEDAPEVEMISKVQLVKLNTLGSLLYGDNGTWTDKRHELASYFSGKRTKSSKELTAEEADRMIAALQKRVSEAAAQAQATPDDNPFTDEEQPEPVTA